MMHDLINFTLDYIADLDNLIKRYNVDPTSSLSSCLQSDKMIYFLEICIHKRTFIEFRKGMLNVSLIGHNSNQEE